MSENHPQEQIDIRRFIRLPLLLRLTGLSRATAHRYAKNDPSFPKGIKLSDSTARNAPVGYLMEDVQRWITERLQKAQQ